MSLFSSKSVESSERLHASEWISRLMLLCLLDFVVHLCTCVCRSRSGSNRTSLSNNSNKNRTSEGRPSKQRASSASRRSTRLYDSRSTSNVNVTSLAQESASVFVAKRLNATRVRLIVDTQLNSMYAHVRALLTNRLFTRVLGNSEWIEQLFDEPIELTTELVGLFANTVLANIEPNEYDITTNNARSSAS